MAKYYRKISQKYYFHQDRGKLTRICRKCCAENSVTANTCFRCGADLDIGEKIKQWHSSDTLCSDRSPVPDTSID